MKSTHVLEEVILQELSNGEQSTTRIASLINRNYYATLKVLRGMEKKGKIRKIKSYGRTYWSKI